MNPIHLTLALTFCAALRLSAQCNLPEPPGTGAQACLDAPVFCATADLDGYCSTTGNTGAGTCPASFCGNCDNYHWIGFVAGSSSIALTITPSNCGSGTGLEAAIYETDNCSSFTLVSNCENPGLVAPISLSASGLVLGQTYYLMIDGFQGDACDYAIDLTQGALGAPPLIQGGISGPGAVCPGGSAAYSVPASAGIANYDWSLSPAIGTIVNDGNNAITVNYIANGVAQLCMTPSNSCSLGSPVCQMVISAPIPPTFQFITFCMGDTWTCEGQTYSQPGQQISTYSSWQGCDSVVICVATAIPPTVMPPVQAVICEGASYSFAGQTFSETGQHTVVLPTYEGCDSILTLNLTVLEANAVIAPPGLFGENGSNSMVLDGSGSTIIPATTGATLSYWWTGPAIVAGGNTLAPVISAPGVYCLQVTHAYQGLQCVDQSCVVVSLTGLPPLQPVLNGPDIACAGTTSTYWPGSSGPGPIITGYTWTVTGGTFTPSGNIIEVTWTTPGEGQVCVTAGNFNGSSPPACLTVQVNEPIVMPPADAVICQGESYAFAGNTYEATGFYSVALTAYNGCDSTVALNLAVLATDAHIAPPGALGCESGATLELDGAGSTSTPSVPGATITYAWTGPGILSGDSTLNPLVNMPGDYILTVTQSYQGVECSGQAQVTVAADTDTPELPLADGPIGVCAGTSATYQATASGTGPAPAGFTWTVSGGTFTSNGEMIDVTWTTEGQGLVCVTADNDCGQSPPACLTVEVKETPVAQFSYQQTGAEVTFADESSETSSWAWNFGDGNISAAQNPVHTYTVDGTYETMLVAGNGICQDTFVQTIEIINVGSNGIEALLEFAISPSPGDGRFTLTLALSRSADLEFKAVNAQGETVFRQDRRAVSQLREEIDLSGLPTGIYFVQLEVEGKRAVRRYLKGD